MRCWANWPGCSAAPARKPASSSSKTIATWPSHRRGLPADSITVKLAHTLQEALDACFSFQPHLLVLDIGLPDGDGFNMVDWLRKHKNLARLPLVVYSGRELSPE